MIRITFYAKDAEVAGQLRNALDNLAEFLRRATLGTFPLITDCNEVSVGLLHFDAASRNTPNLVIEGVVPKSLFTPERDQPWCLALAVAWKNGLDAQGGGLREQLGPVRIRVRCQTELEATVEELLAFRD